RGDLQGFRPSDATSGRARSEKGWSGSLHQRPARWLRPHVAEAIALIDYGAGNLHSVLNALKAAGARQVAVTADPKIVRGARHIVLPGVGSFKTCAQGLRAIPGLVDTIEERVI